MNEVDYKQYEQYEKAGYLKEPFRLFHIRDYTKREFFSHYHDFYKIIFFVDGNVDYKIEGKTYHLKPHDFVLVGANVIHKPEVDGKVPYERYILYLSEKFLRKGNEKNESIRQCFSMAEQFQNRVVHFAPESYESILSCLMKMEKIEKAAAGYLNDILQEAALLEFMVLFNRAVIAQPKAFITTAVYQEKIIDVIAYIQEHLMQELNIDMLAEQFFVSKYYLMHQFKQATGYSVHQYINEKRILAAKRMILAGMPPSKACYECGFHDYSTFARNFKEIVKTSPSKLMF